jgi:N-acetylneuraminic acid mutarotase
VICGGSKTIEVFDFLTKRFQAAADLDQPHYYGTASLLNDRTILIVGGYTESVQSTDSAWIFKE